MLMLTLRNNIAITYVNRIRPADKNEKIPIKCYSNIPHAESQVQQAPQWRDQK